jgi:hypothetical protein
MELQEQYLESVRKQFLYYRTLGEKAMAQLPPDQLFAVYNEDSNSIAVIVKHLWGNMLSRWTDFLTTDGEKEWRQRDAEFDNDLSSAEEVMQKWHEGWDCLMQAINSLQPHQLMDIIYIRNEGHTVAEAINRQLAHYPYHVGQIVFAAKMLKNGGFESLSIPKNQSGSYNAAKFSREKSIRNFTDDELNRLKS